LNSYNESLELIFILTSLNKDICCLLKQLLNVFIVSAYFLLLCAILLTIKKYYITIKLVLFPDLVC